MTGKTRYIIKLILAVFLIIVTPAIFFGAIGDHPMQVRENATRTIAVVNEDNGTEKEEKSLDFGDEISAILKDGSEYKWTFLSRSAAVNGLKNTKYDAVIYIPSDFSKRIMTYESEHPVKAKFEYTIQDQLNVNNREKVLREVENATSRVNGKVSTLYWTYVSQDLENVRTKFDGILQKEIDFQNAMLAFYKPSSKNLTGEIEQQRKMLENIRSTMTTVGKASPKREENVKQFEQSFTSFVKYVEDYRDYQNIQQLMLEKVQDENIVSVQALAANQAPRYSDSMDYLDEQSEQISTNIEAINEQLDENNATVNTLSMVRQNEVERQKSDLINYLKGQETTTLNKHESTIITLKTELNKGAPESNHPDLPGPSAESDPALPTGDQVGTVSAANDSSIQTPGLNEERNELQVIMNELNGLKGSLEAIADPKPEQVTAGINQLPEIAGRLSKVEQKLAAFDQAENPLQKTVDELKAVNNELVKKNEMLATEYNRLAEVNQSLLNQLNSPLDNFQTAVVEIEKQEQEILGLEALTGERKRKLEPIFNKEIYYRSPETLLKYHSSLVQYKETLQNSLAGNPESLTHLLEKVNSMLGVNEQEQNIWDKLSADMPFAGEKLTGLQDYFTGFFTEYSKKMGEQQAAILEDLASLDESANTVMNQVQLMSTDTPIPSNGEDGNTVVIHHKGIGQEMIMMNQLMDSLGESQGNIVQFTDELQTKVQGVQQDANKLNDKWTANVDTTTLVRNDIFNLLGNTFVDGQKNGVVYDHLSNPLEISGNAISKQETKKVPPVVVLVIVLISSLLIGYFSYYFKDAPMLVKGSMFVLLNLIVGLIISLFGLNIYPLGEERAIEWSIFTILLLMAASTVVFVCFSISTWTGWLASVGLVMFFISPLLALTAPNIDYQDPMSQVYMSIQYGTDSLFITAIIVLLGMILLLSVIPYVIRALKSVFTPEEEQAHEA
ncbi:type VII secretion protein EsaA [Peribacillus sp. NPDC096379]|uniref:type VII secretion protein EsaA n=1 Tax=Peribacillus sp. NPDC096379 TaxID=3364393 RepID=UPI0037F7381C